MSIIEHKADIEYAIVFLAKQLASCRALVAGGPSSVAPLIGAQNFYLDRMDNAVKHSARYIKYKKLRTLHKKAVSEAKVLYKIELNDKRVDTFAEEHFDFYACINNARYNGLFGSPACRSTSPLVAKVLRGARLW